MLLVKIYGVLGRWMQILNICYDLFSHRNVKIMGNIMLASPFDARIGLSFPPTLWSSMKDIERLQNDYVYFDAVGADG